MVREDEKKSGVVWVVVISSWSGANYSMDGCRIYASEEVAREAARDLRDGDTLTNVYKASVEEEYCG